MNRTLKYFIILGVFVWLFLMWDRMESNKFSATQVDDAEVSDRCAEFKQDVDGESWTLGYGGRVRQLVRGCF